jgi:hypothetical protein
MRTPVRPACAALLLAVISLVGSPPARAAKIKWSKRISNCEPPAVFYSPNHRPGMRPCCPLVEGACAGGTACPANGVCSADGMACEPAPIAPRPNVVLFIADDQGSCHFGTAGECRSVQSGTPIPPPSTPNLDVLAGYGTVFPIAHNTASWCFPSLDTLLTGRYARNFGGAAHIGDRFATIPKVMRALRDGAPSPADPFNQGNSIGGYCTFLGGKFTGSVGDHGFDALARGRRLGRTNCTPGDGSSPPHCGSEAAADYTPSKIFNMEDLFEFLEGLFLRVPGSNPPMYTMQHFFAWVAPRVPHQPLSSPPAIENYLFGSVAAPALGGLFQLGQYCSGASCAPVVSAFNENTFGTERAYFSNIWWVDDAVREVREYLARASAPHCIDSYGQGRYGVTAPAECQGTWASEIAPDLTRNTAIIYMSDNGWFLPNSKHAFTENGYRTRMIVFDPRTLPTVPGWDGITQAPPPANERFELAHSTDVLPTALGLALGTSGSEPCPASADGTRCDGKDLRPYLATSSPEGAFTAPLRHALCGHHTKRPTAPTKLRYLLTRPGSVGRCTNLDAPACASDDDCGIGVTCLGGHCAASLEPPCSGAGSCPSGALCLGGRCRMAPSCIDDGTCAALFFAKHYACVEKETRWCRNAPGVRCDTRDDCPVCPTGPSGTAAPCSRLCEARQLKVYVDEPTLEMTDLFLDPDERGLHAGGEGIGTVAYDLSRPDGIYVDTMARLSCCVDDWWPEAKQPDSLCTGSCPADFVCNQ